MTAKIKTDECRDTDARHRSDARAREIGCSTAIAALVLGGLIAFVVWGAM